MKTRIPKERETLVRRKNASNKNSVEDTSANLAIISLVLDGPLDMTHSLFLLTSYFIHKHII